MNKEYSENVKANEMLIEAYQYSTYSLKDALGDNGDWED